MRSAWGTIVDLTYIAMAAWWPSTIGSRAQRWVTREFYRYRADRYDAGVAHGGAWYGEPLRAALAHLGDVPSSILDVNTGTGYAVLVLASFFPHARIAACDLSPQMLCRAAVNGEGAGRQFLLVQANAGDLPYQNGAFDLVVSHNAPPPLREMARVLQPGGACVVCFSSGAGVPRRLREAFTQQLRRWGISEIHTGRVARGLFVLGRKTAHC